MSFSIRDHILFKDGKPVTQARTPNVGGPLKPALIVMHYTASQSAAGDISWLRNPQAKASAHLVIDQRGVVTQLAPFNVQTWHAGRSVWKGKQFCNRFSVGIELTNPGPVTKVESGKYKDSNGKPVPADNVAVMTHKNETVARGWATYPVAQIEAAVAVAQAISAAYGVKDIAGHDDIAPDRKRDPGPAFPMASFISKVFGRGDDAPDTRPNLDTYVVMKGDTAIKIAEKVFGDKNAWKTIAALNPTINVNRISPGLVLKLR